LLQGRGLTARDNSASEPVVVVSRAFVRKFWSDSRVKSEPFKAKLVFPDAPEHHWRIIGIADDIHAAGLGSKVPPIVYFSMAQTPDELTEYIIRSPIGWLVRTRGNSRAMRSSIQMQLSQASDGLPVTNMHSMNEILGRSVAGRQFNMLLLIVFGSSALLLAAVGVYGLIAHSVQQRTREIGIRVALGAEPGDVRVMVMLQGFRLVAWGVSIGIAGSWMLTHSIENFLFSLKHQDSVVLTTTPILITIIALVATWIPALRASKLDPVQALRHE
jgi:putative ABC transport system permease protein